MRTTSTLTTTFTSILCAFGLQTDAFAAMPAPQAAASNSGALLSRSAQRIQTANTPQNQAQAAQQLSGELVFVPGLDVSFLGHGVKYDPISNTYTLADQAATLQLNPSTTSATKTRILFEQHHADQTTVQTSSGSLQLDAAIGLFSAAASLGYSSQTGSSIESTSFSLVWEQYAEQYADLSPNAVVYSPTASTILAGVDPQLIEDDWNAHLGSYVVIGAPQYTSLRLTISISSSSSYSDSKRFADLQASYAGYAAKASFAEALYQAMNSSGLSWSIEGVGVDMSQLDLPILSEIDEDAEQIAFMNQIEDMMASPQNAPTGAILAPVMALPGAPEIAGENFDPFVVGQAASAVRTGLQALARADHWNRSSRVRSFLENRFAATSGTDLHTLITDEKTEVVTAMSALWTAFKRHLASPNEPTYVSMLNSQLQDCLSRIADLQDALYEAELAVSAMSAQPTVVDNSIYNASTAVGYMQIFQVTLENVAIFDDTDILDVRPFLEERTHLYSHDPSIGAHVDYPCYDFFLVGQPTIVPSGEDAGLFNVSYKFKAKVYTNSSHVEFYLEDDLHRPFGFEHWW